MPDVRSIPLSTGAVLAVELIVPTPSPHVPSTTENNQATNNTLIFVHGLAAQRTVWRETTELLAVRGYRCVLVDLRGHGDSSGSTSTTHQVSSYRTSIATGLGNSDQEINARFCMAKLADDLAALVAALSIAQPLVWVGHSYGGNVCMEVAVRHRSLVAGLCLVDGGFINLQAKWNFENKDQCMQTLSPPSFVGMSRGELERAVRGVWSGRKWTELGIQAMLHNFHTVVFNATTTTAAIATTTSSHAYTGTHTSGLHDGTSIPIPTPIPTSTSTAASTVRRQTQTHTTTHPNSLNHVFESVQPKLLFRHHMALLEDLWARLPSDQLAQLSATDRLGDSALTPPPPLTPPLTQAYAQTHVQTPPQTPPMTAAPTSMSLSLPLPAPAPALPLMTFVVATAATPFSRDKQRDLRAMLGDAMPATAAPVMAAKVEEDNAGTMSSHSRPSLPHPSSSSVPSTSPSHPSSSPSHPSSSSPHATSSRVRIKWLQGGHEVPLEQPQEIATAVCELTAALATPAADDG